MKKPTDLKNYAGKRLCAAVSGGADSVWLLYDLKEKEKEYGFFLSAVHCEHGIRGETSLADCEFVRTLCAKWGVPLTVFSADCPREAINKGESLETAAREFRYRSFQTLLDEGKADVIVTAHHLDDDAETVLFRLCRGASLTGASGISSERKGFLRPLLDLTKNEILENVRAHGLTYREDESNKEREATRNKLRLDVFPILEEAIHGTAKNLVRFANHAAEDDELLYAYAKKLVYQESTTGAGDTGYRVRTDGEPPLVRRAVLTVLKALGVERDYGGVHLDRAVALTALQTGAKATLLQGVYAVRMHDSLAFFREAAEEKLSPIPFEKGTYEWGRYEIVVSDQLQSDGETWGRVLRLDGEKIPKTAVFRCTETGDTFRKFGGGSKTVKKYLVDKKIPAAVRADLPVLADGETGEVLAILGVEISDGVRLTEQTAREINMLIRRKKQ